MFFSRRGSSYSDSHSDYSDRDGSRSPSPGGGSEVKESGFDLFEPFSPVNSPDHLFDLSDEEMIGEKRVSVGILFHPTCTASLYSKDFWDPSFCLLFR